MRRRLILMGLGTLALACPLAGADEVILKNGHRIEGIVREESGKVIIDLDSGTITLDRSQVAKIVRSVSPLEEFAAKVKNLKENDIEGAYKLGVWAKERELHHKAKSMFERVIAANPDHEEARKALGYAKHEGKWLTEDELMVALGFVRRNGEWLKKETVEKILAEEYALQREREASVATEKIAQLEAEVRRLEIAAQRERDQLLADIQLRTRSAVLVSPLLHYHYVGGVGYPCCCASYWNLKKK